MDFDGDFGQADSDADPDGIADFLDLDLDLDLIEYGEEALEALLDCALDFYDHAHGCSSPQNFGGSSYWHDAPSGSTRESRLVDPFIKKTVEFSKKNRRLFGFHVVSHGLVDFKSEINKVAPELKAYRVDGVTPNLPSAEIFEAEISDWDKFSPPYTRRRMPSGYYKGATGTTTVLSQSWQVKKTKNLWDCLSTKKTRFNDQPPIIFNRDDHLLLDVTIATWYFREIGDFETRFQIRLVTLPYYDSANGAWVKYLVEPLARYQKAAEAFSSRIFEVVKGRSPQPEARERRLQLS